MNIRDLKYFLTVAELGHFGQAASRCCVSQPTLSGQIKKLEEELGVTLFERTNRKVMLTEPGQRIAAIASRIFCDVEEIHTVAKNSHNPMAGNFRLGAFPTLSAYIFPSLVPRVKSALPNLKLILIEEKTASLVEKLKQGEIDAAFLALPVRDDSLVSHKLFDDPFYLAVPTGHPLAKHKAVSQKILSKHRLLLLEEGHCLRDQALDVCRVHAMSEEQDIRATGMETLRQMVKAGTGITLMPRIATQNDESGIEYIPFTSSAPSRSIALVWRKTTARQELIDILTSLCLTQDENKEKLKALSS